ncbi:MAG: LLM class flavin-dependent oxidoreductase, partial [Pseudomonadales bacterium]|nr:LLM class flavin-dependent oxidoreductase [Pseudomonadales bacterium]
MTLPDPRGVEPTIEMAKWAEAEGYDDLWFADSSGVDALTTAAAVAMSTKRCRIGTAIIPVFSRTPAVLASTSHVLHKLSGGRFILGLGSSSQTMMENWHGQKFEKPLTRVKETTL